MLLSIFASIKSWGEGLGEGKRKTITFLFFALGIVGVVVGVVLNLPLDSLSVIIGSIVGLLWLVSLNFAYWFLLPEKTQESLDYRSEWDLSRRRWVAGTALAVWFLLLVLINTSLPEQLNVLFGALNVLILVSLARFAVADDGEREQWSEQKEEERREKLALEAYENGLIDEYGNPVPVAMRKSRKKKKKGLERLGIKVTRTEKTSPFVPNNQFQQAEVFEEYVDDYDTYEEEIEIDYDVPQENTRILSPEEVRQKNSRRSQPSPPPSF